MVIEKAKSRMSQLETAIRRVDSVKKHLNYSATEIKSQIHSSISRHLEALRNREVWLLNQVDLVLSAKEEVLHDQQARLNKTLGVLQSGSTLTEDDDSLETRLAEALDKLDLSDLQPEETPYITFRADQSSFREAILNYGRVDASGMPLQSAFVEHGNPSASLPRHFEEYDDAEHHVFYKTVEEVNRSRTASSSICVNIPKLSTRPEDWLFRPTTVTTMTTSEPRFSFPAFSTNPSDWVPDISSSAGNTSSMPNLTGNPSIQNWLSQIKRNPDLEDEEDFEIVDRSAPSVSDASESVPSTPVTLCPVSVPPPVFEDLLKQKFPSAVEAWLKSSSLGSEDKVSDKETYNFFKHIPVETDVWLVKGKEKAEEKERCADCSCSIKSQEIENLGSFTCTTLMGRFFRDLPRDTRCWLKDSMTSNRVPPVIDVCKANEPCQDYKDCVCQPNCGIQFVKGGKSAIAEWLKTKEDKETWMEQKDYFSALMSSKNEKWLDTQSISRLKEDATMEDEFPFFHTISKIPSDWLKHHQSGVNKNSPGITIPNFEFKHSKEDCNIWLKAKGLPADAAGSVQPCPVWEALQSVHSQMSQSDWLYKPGQQEPENKNDGNIKCGAEDGWLLCGQKCQNGEVLITGKYASGFGEWLYQKNL